MSNPLDHSPQFKRRRFINWFPLGLCYALLYMGRYNLTVGKAALGDMMSKEAFGTIFGVGAWVYALAFLVNGPLTDKLGGRRGMLTGMLGAIVSNLVMGVYIYHVMHAPEPAQNLTAVFTALYAVNMYFQSFGAVAIVKVNAHWFHVKERGIFGAIFGIMISTGLWLAFDLNSRILNSGFVSAQGVNGGPAVWWVFLLPAGLLAMFWCMEFFLLKDRPSQAGFSDFDTADASSGEDETMPPVKEILRKILTNPIILTIALVEFCTGILRNGIMHWFLIYSKDANAMANISAASMTGFKYAADNWGLMLMIAGITGGLIAGYVSDKLFQSRRAPAAGFLYGTLSIALLAMIFSLENGWAMATIAFVVSICVIGTHGMLSGTATMDFGGRKAAGTAVGIIDGFVYLGTGLQSLAIGFIVSSEKLGWAYWPVFLAPFGLAGLILLTRIWHAKPAPKERVAG